METKSSFLHLFEKLEGFAGKLPGALQKPILKEVTPLKDLFLRQRAPRLVLTGEAGVSSAGLFNAIFGAPVAPFVAEGVADAVPPSAGWQDFSHAGRGVLRVLDARLAGARDQLPETTAALAAEPLDLILFLAPPGNPSADASALDGLERLLDLAERSHQIRPCVQGIVVDTSESALSAEEADAARGRLQAALAARPRIARHLAPSLAVSTFIRFRLDGTFDPESDRRRGVAELVDALVTELPNEARLEMARLSGARAAQAKIAQTLIKSFTAASGALGAQPIPLADLPFLLGFQLAMVAGIIYVSGREPSLKLATEFMGTMGINVGVGLALREGARAAGRAAAKLLLPGVGNAISGLVAAGGTYAIGRAASAYYIEGMNVAEARELLKQSRRPGKGIFHLLDRRKNLEPVKLSAIRAALAELDLAPSKSLGQNFLHDQNLARWIVAQLDAGPDDELVEIGPGLGALTEAALATGARLTALEKDGRLAEYLRRRFAGNERCRVIHGDALEFDVRGLWPRRPVKVFGNLPYYISTPLIFHFTSPAAPVERAVFLLQRELAERLAAGPGTKDYGILSVVLGRRWRVRLLKVMPASVFLPEPKVDSALVSLELRGAGELPACDPQTFERIVRAGFSQRRKQLRKLLAALGADAAPVLVRWPEVTARLGVTETVRGEELDLLRWITLANVFSPVDPATAQDAQAERFDVVDAQDRVIDVQPRGVVHANDLRHRAVHLFVFNGQGELFLQKRSPWKDKHPGKWDSSAAGHLDSGEDYPDAARRELGEELGLDPDRAPLEEIGALTASEATGWEFVRIFQTRHDGPFRWPPEEIEWGGFFPVDVVQAWSEAHPEDFAPGFLECRRVWRAASPAGKTA